MKIGYARVSTLDQSVARQIDELRAAGCEQVYSEAASGKHGSIRPEWDRCLQTLRAGDVLTVCELSRLGRHTGDLSRLLDDLDARNIALLILDLKLDTSTAAGRLVYSILSAVAAMERDLLAERTRSGLAAARARGRVGGRRQSITHDQIKRAQRLYNQGHLSAGEIAKVVGVSRATLYRYLTTADRKTASA